MKRQTKLNSVEQQQQQAAEQQTQQQSAREFATAEELLRYDAEHTPVPAGIAQRLQQSTETLPRPNRSWWKRFFKH
jgi:hypothetical protein